MFLVWQDLKILILNKFHVACKLAIMGNFLELLKILKGRQEIRDCNVEDLACGNKLVLRAWTLKANLKFIQGSDTAVPSCPLCHLQFIRYGLQIHVLAKDTNKKHTCVHI